MPENSEPVYYQLLSGQDHPTDRTERAAGPQPGG